MPTSYGNNAGQEVQHYYTSEWSISNVIVLRLWKELFKENVANRIFTQRPRSGKWDRPSLRLPDWKWKEPKFKKVTKGYSEKNPKSINSLSTRWLWATHYKWTSGCVVYKQADVKLLECCNFKKKYYLVLHLSFLVSSSL